MSRALGDVFDPARERMSALFLRAITDPSAAREELFTALAELDEASVVADDE